MAMTEAPPAATRTRGPSGAPGHGSATRSGSTGSPRPVRPPVTPDVYIRRRIVVGLAVVALLVGGLVAIRQLRGGSPTEAAPNLTVAPAAAAATEAADAAATDQAGDTADPATLEPVAEEAPTDTLGALDGGGCMLDEVEVKRGDTGESVECAQTALLAAGYYTGEINGTFDDLTYLAARDFQVAVGLYVDGIVGKNTATELGIWPGNEAFIVRTPPPPAGATDLWGMALSSVASAGDDAPPLPEGAGQGTGKRVVYERASQRVWAIDDEERIVRSYLVSGSQYRNEVPGVHTIYSKSESALGWDLQADLPYMIRYTQTERGHIGFHAIPSWRDTGEKLQTEDELGQKLSGGCTRQAPLDAQFLWAFADVGDKVHVL